MNRLVRVVGNGRRQTAVVTRQTRDRGFFEQVDGVFELADGALADRLAPIVVPDDVKQRQAQIEVGDFRRQPDRLRPHAGQLQAVGRNLVEGEEGLDHLVAAQVPLLFQVLDQAFEGQLLVIEGLQRDLGGVPDLFAERLIGGEIDRQRQRVDEEPDQAFQLGVGPVGDWRSDQQSILAGVAGQQDAERRPEDDERADALSRAEAVEPVHQLGRQLKAKGGAAAAEPIGPRFVDRQVQNPGIGPNQVSPKGDQALQPFAGQALALPYGEVRVLDGHFRPGLGLAEGERAIGERQLAHKDLGGDQVVDDVVKIEQKRVAGLPEPDQAAAEQGPLIHVERVGGVGAGERMGQ